MNRQKLITILATIAIITTLIVSLFYPFGSATATTYNADNMTVTGVLASDNYVLFPYEKYNLIFGFSKYGELINGAVKQGLEYRGMDVFANPNVLEEDWSQGWFIDIHYADNDNAYKNVWAFAMYSDLSGSAGIGGDWQEGCTGGTLAAPHGGRKTNAYATTDPIKVLYDGPRRFVALTHTIIYEDSGKTKALVGISITFVFNKDKKNVILYKDIKRLDLGKWGRTFQVEFSNRGEWDIGTTASPPSYAHFYDDLSTVYDYEYHDFYNATYDVTGFDTVQMIDEGGSYTGFAAFWPQLFGKLVDGTNHITQTTVLSSLCTKEYNYTWDYLGSPARRNVTFIGDSGLGWPTADLYPRGAGLWDDAPMVFKNGILLSEGSDYTWDGTIDEIQFTIEPTDTDYITVVYKHQTPTGGGADDMNDHTTEPRTPYVIGEWCFDLEDEDEKRQFRAVTMYGLTDRHDADDDDADAETWQDVDSNVIDCEVQYYLNETFNPYDLYNAVHKQESRWLYYDDSLTTATSYITLTEGIDDTNYYNITAGAWEPYYLSPERWTGDTDPVESAWVNEFEDGATFLADFAVTDLAHSKHWALDLNATFTDYEGTSNVEMLMITPKATTPTATAPLTLQLGDLVDFDFWYNPIDITSWGPWIEINVTNTANPALATSYLTIQASTNNPTTAAGWHHYTLNTIEDFMPGGGSADAAFNLADKTGDITETGWHSFEYWTSKYPDYYVHYVGVGQAIGRSLIDDVSIGYLERASGIRYERVYNMEEDKLIPTDWDRYCSFSEKVLVDGVLIDRDPYYLLRNYVEGGHAPYYTINFENGTINFYHYVSGTGYTTWTLPIGTHIKVLYSTIEENEKGRYEWMVVGKDAATVDSIGAAYMTEAFDSIKDIHVQVTSLDINDTVYGPHTPFVMGGAVTGTKADYRDSLGRTYLRDDWCTTYPVASSNMLFAGGPEVNMGAEYFNEFTMAFFARTDYVVNDTGHAYEIFALSCWNKYSYGSGYAVVSVYKDLNGTIGFLIWGFTGDDTYYATKWFWEEGIEYLQGENRGVTDIILEIDYTTCPYSVDLAVPSGSTGYERLGTISEKSCHDP